MTSVDFWLTLLLPPPLKMLFNKNDQKAYDFMDHASDLALSHWWNQKLSQHHSFFSPVGYFLASIWSRAPPKYLYKKKEKTTVFKGIGKSDVCFVVWPYNRLCQKGESDSYKWGGRSNISNWPINQSEFFYLEAYTILKWIVTESSIKKLIFFVLQFWYSWPKRLKLHFPTKSGLTSSCSPRLCLPEFATGTKCQFFHNINFSKINPNLSLSLYITENKSCSFSASPSLFHGFCFSLVNESILSIAVKIFLVNKENKWNFMQSGLSNQKST